MEHTGNGPELFDLAFQLFQIQVLGIADMAFGETAESFDFAFFQRLNVLLVFANYLPDQFG